MNQSIRHYLLQIEDFRQANKCVYRLADILLVGLCTFLSNGQDYEDMVLFAQTRGSALPDLIDLSRGTPSHETVNRVFQLPAPELLRLSLEQHGEAILDLLAQKQICLDGKKLKGVSPRSKATAGLWLVNAWVSENRLCVGQPRLEDKSNEIDLLVPLINQLDLEEAVVTIDATGCQTAVAQQIIDQKGHYLLALKRNQDMLLEEVECAFRANRGLVADEPWAYARDRFEQHRCWLLAAGAVIDEAFMAHWPGLQTLVKIEAHRSQQGQTRMEVRYYISDESVSNPRYYSKLARGHWGIENHLHRSGDPVAFRCHFQGRCLSRMYW